MDNNDDVSLSTEDLDDLKDLFQNVYESGAIGKSAQSSLGSSEPDVLGVSSGKRNGNKRKKKGSFTEGYDELQELRAEYQRSKKEKTRKNIEHQLKRLELHDSRLEHRNQKLGISNDQLDVDRAHLFAQSEVREKKNSNRSQRTELQTQAQEHSKNILNDRQSSQQKRIQAHAQRQKISAQKEKINNAMDVFNPFMRQHSSTSEGKQAGKDAQDYMKKLKLQAANGTLGQPMDDNYSGVLSKRILDKLPMGFNTSSSGVSDYINRNANYSANTDKEVANFPQTAMAQMLSNVGGAQIQSPNFDKSISPGNAFGGGTSILGNNLQKLNNNSDNSKQRNGSSSNSATTAMNTEIRWWIKMQDTLDEINDNIKKLLDSSISGKEKLPQAVYNRRAEKEDKDGSLLTALGPIALMLGGLFAEKFGPISNAIQQTMKSVSDIIKGFGKSTSYGAQNAEHFMGDLSHLPPDIHGTNPIFNAFNAAKDKIFGSQQSSPAYEGPAKTATDSVKNDYSMRQIKMRNQVLKAREEHRFLSENGNDEEKKLSFERMNRASNAYKNRYGGEALQHVNEPLSHISEVPSPAEIPKINSMNSFFSKIPGAGLLGKLGKALNVGGQLTTAYSFGADSANTYKDFKNGDMKGAFGSGLRTAGDSLGLASLRAGNPVASGLLFEGSSILSGAGDFTKGYDSKNRLAAAKAKRAGIDAAGITAGIGVGAAIGSFVPIPGVGTLAGAAIGGATAWAGQGIYNHFNPVEKSLAAENASANMSKQTAPENNVNTSNSYNFQFTNPVIKSNDDAKKVVNQALAARDNVQKAQENFNNAGQQNPALKALDSFGFSF